MFFSENAVTGVKNITVTLPMELCHDTLDIIYVMEGNLTALLPSLPKLTLTHEDVIVLEPEASIHLIPDDTVGYGRIIRLSLSAAFVDHYLGPATVIRCNSALAPRKNYRQLRSDILAIAVLYSNEEKENQLDILSFCFSLLSELKRSFSFSSYTMTATKHPDRVEKIARYMERNYHKSLTLTALAQQLYLTPQYLSRFFTKNFHKSFNAYLTEIRLKHARQDLLATTLDMTQIAVNNGFGSSAVFSKSFKNYYGMTPTAYRKKEAQAAMPSCADFGENAPEPSGPKEPTAIRTISSNMAMDHSTPKLLTAFTSLINAGHAMNFLDSDFLEQFHRANELLHFRYVRLEYLVSSAVIPTLAQNGQHVFGNVHRILDILREMELIPLIELGRTPPTVFANFDTGLCTGAQPGVQNSRFMKLFESFLEDIIHRYGQSWVSSFQFELWQPGTPLDGVMETAKDYAQRFLDIHSVLKKHIPKALLGGPGFDICQKPLELFNSLEALKAANIRPDFISVYFYGMEYIDESPALCTSCRALEERLSMVYSKASDIYKSRIPIYATKINYNMSDNTLINDSCFHGAWLTELMLMAGKYCRLTGYWTLSDITGLISDPVDIRQTGPGLYRKNGIPKPSYYALAFLNQLGHYEIDRGPGYILTANGPGDYRLLIYHYSDLSYRQRLSYPAMTSLRDVARLFEISSAPETDYVLEHIPKGTYRIRRRHLDYANGSILDIDTQGFSHSNLEEKDYLIHAMNTSAEDLYYLKASCIPETRTIYVRAEESLTLKVRPQSNSLYLFEIILEPDFS